MKSIYIVILFVFNSFSSNSQNEELVKRFNGTYHLLEAERGINNKPTKTKVVQFGENNGTELLAIAACEKCMPAVYTYLKEESKKYGVPIFLNSMGLYVLGYDADSFIIVLVTKKLGDGKWKNFSFSNFYSKTKSKVAKINKEKIALHAKEISEKMIK